jgi:DNA-binding FadR family transcriptional regulator
MSRHIECMRVALARLANGSIAPGDALPREKDMAEQWGFSRPAVRDAMKALIDRGIVKVTHGRGQTVRPAEDWNMLDAEVVQAFAQAGHGPDLHAELVEVRLLVEVPAAGLAAERARKAHIADLTDAHRRMAVTAEVEVVGGWPDLYAEAQADFHRALARAVDNRPLQRLLNEVQEAVRALGEPPTRRPAAVGELQAVVDAIAARDGEASSAAMRTHLEAVAAQVPRRRGRRRRA